MPEKREKVVVAMSGGVDSSVAACLLVERGYEVIGVFMRHGVQAPEPDPGGEASGAPATGRSHQGCCSATDASDARFVAGMLDIPFYVLNFEHDFDRLIDYFADEYSRGRTPNPCVVCNDRLKFGRVVEYADAVGAEFIATGHHARISRRDGRNALMTARDRHKDQSYVLFGLERAVLDRLLFPVGEFTKAEVRDIAAKYDLPNRDKPDSVEICFVPDRDYARIVRERRPEAFVEGDVVDTSGAVIGRHGGVPRYTIGQRRGLGIAAGKPVYVTELNVGNNTITLGDGDALLRSSLIADRAKFLVELPDGPFRAEVKIRYLHTAAPATVYRLDGGTVRVDFDEPQRAITPGQAVVFYDGDLVLGGAWIDRALPNATVKTVFAPSTTV